MDNLLTQAEVAKMLGVSRQWIYRHRKIGDFPEPISIGGKRMWAENTINNWVKLNAIK